MNYSLPFNEHIELPGIEKINKIELMSDEIICNESDISGVLMIKGQYRLGDEEVNDFKHEIPISLIVNATRSIPSIDIKKFDYSVIPNKGLEIMLEILINVDDEYEEEELYDYQANIDAKVDSYVVDRKINTNEEDDLLLLDEIEQIKHADDDLDVVEECERVVEEKDDLVEDNNDLDVVEELDDLVGVNHDLDTVEDYDRVVEELDDLVGNNQDYDNSVEEAEREYVEYQEDSTDVGMIVNEEIPSDEMEITIEHQNINCDEKIFEEYKKQYDNVMVYKMKEHETLQDVANKYQIPYSYVQKCQRNYACNSDNKVFIPLDSD